MFNKIILGLIGRFRPKWLILEPIKTAKDNSYRNIFSGDVLRVSKY